MGFGCQWFNWLLMLYWNLCLYTKSNVTIVLQNYWRSFVTCSRVHVLLWCRRRRRRPCVCPRGAFQSTDHLHRMTCLLTVSRIGEVCDADKVPFSRTPNASGTSLHHGILYERILESHHGEHHRHLRGRSAIRRLSPSISHHLDFIFYNFEWGNRYRCVCVFLFCVCVW